MVINPIVGVYIPIKRIPLKGEMTIPNIATFDHGTNDSLLDFFCRWKFYGEKLLLLQIPFGDPEGERNFFSGLKIAFLEVGTQPNWKMLKLLSDDDKPRARNKNGWFVNI